MFSHICLGTNNLSESMAFYDQVMPVLGVSRQDTGDTYAGYGNQEDIGSGVNCLFIGNTFNGEPATVGNGVNIALLAQTRKQVVKFHQIALENGGQDEGAPGLRALVVSIILFHAGFQLLRQRQLCFNEFLFGDSFWKES